MSGPIGPDTSDRYIALAALAARHGALDGSSPDLSPFELRVFSQNGEDGVIAELLRRCGVGTRWFCEFGTGPGTEANCVFLADVLGWSGLFCEPDPGAFAEIERKYASNPRVRTLPTPITPANVDEVFGSAGVPEEPDVISIDVDGADYWIWEAMEAHRPRIVVAEYNSALPPDRQLVKPLKADGEPWDGTDYFGASLGALLSLADAKGYRFVHTDLAGANAFFVRSDLPGDYPNSATVPQRAMNFFLLGATHATDPHDRPWYDLDSGGLTRLGRPQRPSTLPFRPSLAGRARRKLGSLLGR